MAVRQRDDQTIPPALAVGDTVSVEYTERAKQAGQIKKQQIERSFEGDVVELAPAADARREYRYVDVDTDGDGDVDRRVFAIGAVIRPTGADVFDAKEYGVWADVERVGGGT